MITVYLPQELEQQRILVAQHTHKFRQNFILPYTFADCYSEQKGFKQNDVFYQKDSHLVMAVVIVIRHNVKRYITYLKRISSRKFPDN